MNELPEMLEKAISIAVEAHSGQLDRSGRPYILHPLRVMHSMGTDEEKIVALLHDVIEDSDITMERLRAEGFGEPVLAAIAALTRNKGEEYHAYIQRLACVPLAVRVKRADLADNMNATRNREFTDSDSRRFARYVRAWVYLQGIDL